MSCHSTKSSIHNQTQIKSHFKKMCVCFYIILYVNCFGRAVLCVCIEYCTQVNMYHVSTQGIDEHMINVHYYDYHQFVYYQSHTAESDTRLFIWDQDETSSHDQGVRTSLKRVEIKRVNNNSQVPVLHSQLGCHSPGLLSSVTVTHKIKHLNTTLQASAINTKINYCTLYI